MTPRIPVLLGAVVGTAVVAGCSSAGPAAPAPTASTIVTVVPDCTAVTADARALATEVGRLLNRETTLSKVQAAVDDLAASIDNAKGTASAAVRELYDRAGQALRDMRNALTAQPVDWPAARAAADALVAAFRDAANVCDVPT